jgi:mevalonate kinase
VNAAAKRAGFIASKLTGAGGGGCVITCAPPNASAASRAAFIAEMHAAGRDCFETTIGQAGVVVYDGKGTDDFTLDLA